ncbi:MAG: polysaccharide deacetylase family protein [Hyphomicrobiales bacterium]
MIKLYEHLNIQKLKQLIPASKLVLSGLLCLSVAVPASAQGVTRSPLEPLTAAPTSTPSLRTLAPTTSIQVRKPTTQSVNSGSAQACAGKLGVHRTIKVSPKNAFLVGVDNHARLGLRRKEVVLTFDDGPRAGITEPILKALADECVLATFFALGRSARQFPHLLARVAKEGHTVGTHSQSHPLLTKRNSDGVDAEVRRGIASAEAALKGSGHELSNFFRYPYLARSKRTDAIVKGYGLVGFHMNIDSWDWKDQTPEEMLQTTLRRTRGEGSGIVLFHDIQEKTAIALPKYLRILRQEGYKIVHLIPGDSDFDYRQDLASRVPTPLVRPAFAPNTPSGAIVPVSTGNAALENVTDNAVVASVSPVTVDDASSLNSTEGSLLEGNRANAASRLRALELQKEEEKKELAKRERARRLAALPAPQPKRKPKRRKVTSLQPKSNTPELRGSQPINSDPVQPVITGQNPSSEQTATIASGFEPLPKKKKKKRFRLFRKLFTNTDEGS